MDKGYKLKAPEATFQNSVTLSMVSKLVQILLYDIAQGLLANIINGADFIHEIKY